MADKVLEVTSAQINTAVKKANALTAVAPVAITNNKINLNIDNQTIQTNNEGQLVANLDELGNEVNTIANNLTKKQDKLVDGVNIKTINGEPITGSGNITIKGGSVVNEQYGIKGDYATQYGILECPNGILTVSGLTVTLKQGVVMQCAGQDIKTTVANDKTYTIEATSDIDLFYAGGSILECGEVFYQENEPDNGTANYIAWWKPSLGKWQFKSNATGNVFREAIACRLAHIHTDGTTITRIDYIGNRVLDDEIFLEAKDFKTINGETIVGKGDITIKGGSGSASEWVGSYKMMLEGTQAGSFEINLSDVLTENSQYEILMRAYLNAKDKTSQTNTYISSEIWGSERNCYVASTNVDSAKYATSVFTFPIGTSKKFTISCNVEAQKYQFEMFAYKKVG